MFLLIAPRVTSSMLLRISPTRVPSHHSTPSTVRRRTTVPIRNLRHATPLSMLHHLCGRRTLHSQMLLLLMVSHHLRLTGVPTHCALTIRHGSWQDLHLGRVHLGMASRTGLETTRGSATATRGHLIVAVGRVGSGYGAVSRLGHVLLLRLLLSGGGIFGALPRVYGAVLSLSGRRTSLLLLRRYGMGHGLLLRGAVLPRVWLSHLCMLRIHHWHHACS